MKQAVIIKSYDRRFSTYFEKEKRFLLKYLRGDFEIHHVGSTAVPGLGGKNVLDIQLLLPTRKLANKIIRKLRAIGYNYKKNAGDSFRRFFDRNRCYGRKRIHVHLHLMWKSAGKYRNYLMFRDYLRAHPKEAKKYFSLKKKLARLAGDRKEKYTAMKTDYVLGVVRKASKQF